MFKFRTFYTRDQRAIGVDWYLRTWDEEVAGKTAFWHGLVKGGASRKHRKMVNLQLEKLN